GESDGVVFEVRGRGEHYDVRHAVVDERDRYFFRHLIGGGRDRALLPALDGNLDAARLCGHLRSGAHACVGSRSFVSRCLIGSPVAARRFQASRWLTFTTCTAVTLYSGQLVAQSEFSVVTMFAPVSGKWNVVYTTPGWMRSVTTARSTISPVRLVTPTQSPFEMPRTSASCG